MMIFESLWVPPNLYAAEGPLVVAGQLSLTGVDSFYWFASGGEEWGPCDGKWAYNTPMQMGLFPATALAFRQGYIAEADEPVGVRGTQPGRSVAAEDAADRRNGRLRSEPRPGRNAGQLGRFHAASIRWRFASDRSRCVTAAARPTTAYLPNSTA